MGPAQPASPLVSYSQNGEDVLLARVFGGQPTGFYIDCGAWHPVVDSVTKHFSTHGWRGVNVEPNPTMLDLLRRDRPNDVNLGCALGRAPGRAKLLLRSNSSLSTLKEARAATLAPGERELDVEVETLARVCERHAAARIDFLKVDVEGGERAVLEGADWDRFRPRLVLVEATRPETDVPSWDDWEPILVRAGYRFLYFDGLNRFYADGPEHAQFAPHFERPVNILDRFVRHEMVTLTHELRLREKEIAKLGERICAADRLNDELRASVSWRLTEPLRQVSVGLGALQRRLADLGR